MAARTVRAARLVQHGQPLEVAPVPLAEPDDADVVLEMAYAGVNPVDRYITLGRVGAEVWGQTGRAAKVEAVEAAGATRATVVEDPGSLGDMIGALAPTVVFDPLGDGFTGAAIEALQPRGRLVIFGTSADARGDVPLQALYRKGLTVRGYGGLSEPPETLHRGMAGALEAIREGRMGVQVDSVLPLDAAQVALDRLADRAVSGKLVLSLAGAP